MLDLTRLSFEDIVVQLKRKLSEKDAWKDVYLASTGTTLIELYAYVLQLLLYYLKRTAEEMFIDTAQYWSSLVRLANLLGLYVKRPRGAEGIVRMQLKGNVGKSVKVVKAFTKVFCGETVLYVVNDNVVRKREYTDVLVRQGERRKVSFVVKEAKPVLKFSVDDVTASDQDLVVKVGGTVFGCVTDLYDLIGENVVRVVTAPDKKLVLQFFKTHARLNVGDVVEVEYSSVVEGWKPSALESWSCEDEEIELVPVLDSFVFGGRWETIEELRGRLVNFFGAGKRVVTVEDLEKTMLSIQGVEKVKVVDVKHEWKAPYGGAIVYVKPEDGWEINQVLRNRIQAVLGKLGLIGIRISVHPVQRVDVDVYVVVKRKVGVPDLAMESEIMELMVDLYSKAEVGKWIARDDIIRVLRLRGYDVYNLVLPDKDLRLWEHQMCALRNVKVDFVD